MTKPRDRHGSHGKKASPPSKEETNTKEETTPCTSTTTVGAPRAGTRAGGEGKGRRRPPLSAAGRALRRTQKEFAENVAAQKQALAELLDEVKSGSRASPFSEIQHPQKRAFLTAFALLGTKVLAMRAVGLDQSTLYTRQWLDDREFQAALSRARTMAADVFEHEAYRRGVEGVEEPAGWYMGQPGAMVRKFSDVLLIFTLKGLLPERYRERVDLRGSLAHIDLKQLPDELLARIVAGEHPFSVLAPGQEGVPVLGTGEIPDAAIEESEDVTDVTRDSRDAASLDDEQRGE